MSETHAVYTTRTADKDLEKIPEEDRGRVLQTILSLGDDPRPVQSIQMSGSAGRRVRWGDYRALYEVDDEKKEVTVTRVLHRKDVYKRR